MASASPPAAGRAGPFGTLLTAALAIALGVLLAWWTWVFVAPLPAQPAKGAEDSAVDFAAIARLFGATAPGPAGAGTGAGWRLKGVVAPTPGVAASAIFSSGSGRDVAVYVDGDLPGGWKLVEVHPDHVLVERAGVRSRIDLEVLRRGQAAPPVASRGFRVTVSRTGSNSFALSRKELDEALRDPGQLNFLGQIGMPPGGGVRMEQAPPGSLAQKLGLQPGDVIRRVNGQAVASTGDLARLYTQFNTLSSIQAEVQRGASTVQLTYAIQP